MTREIKFRAWDKQNKNMTYFGECGEDILYFDGGISWTRNHDGDGYSVESFELMQYTGLHDKNGKEIYEGDIVKFGRDSELDVIKWDDQDYLIENQNYLKVIGNIYENPKNGL